MHVRRALVRAATTAACAASLLVTTAPGVSAGATDLVLAIAETEAAIALSVADAARANVEHPDVTCANPLTAGVVVVPPVHVPRTVSVHGQDLATGEGHCASLQGRSYTVTLRVVVQWRDSTGSWNALGPEGHESASSTAGVAVVVVRPFLTGYDPAGEAAGKPHRVYAVLTNSLTGVPYEGYSQVFLTPQGDEVAELAQS